MALNDTGKRVSRIADLVMVLAGMREQSRAAEYFHMGMLRFLTCYGRNNYDDASVWSRRLAEAFCITVLKQGYKKEPYSLLGEMTYDLPWSVSNHPVFHHLSDDLERLGAYLGCGLSGWKVWDDLRYMQWYGNSGAHASRYLEQGPLEADAEVFVSTLRIVVCFIAFHRRTYGYTSRL